MSSSHAPGFDAALRAGTVFLLALGCEHHEAPAEPAPAGAVPPPAQPRRDLAELPPPPPAEPEATNSKSSAAARPRKALGVPAPARAASPCDGECRGGATAELRSALRLEAVRARSCYERVLSQNGRLSGSVELSVRVGPNGEVCSAGLSKDTLGDAEVTACVVQRFRGASFPKPSGGCIDAAVPINFVPHKSGA